MKNLISLKGDDLPGEKFFFLGKKGLSPGNTAQQFYQGRCMSLIGNRLVK